MPLPTFFNLPESKRQTLLDCACAEFAQHDYNQASISKIVAQAGIAKGSLYQYFADKRDLHRYLLELAAQKKAELLSDYQPPEPDTPLFESLRHLFTVMLTFELRYPQLAKIGSRAINGSAPLPEEVLLKAKRSTIQYFQELIETGKQQGVVRPQVDAGMAAYIFSSALAGMSEYLQTRRIDAPAENESAEDGGLRSEEIETAFNQVLAIFQNGIANDFVEKGKPQ